MIINIGKKDLQYIIEALEDDHDDDINNGRSSRLAKQLRKVLDSTDKKVK